MGADRNQASKTARAHLIGSADITRRVAEELAEAIVAVADLIAETFRGGGKLLLCGNGGSAADCQHLAAEFLGRFRRDFERPGLPAVPLTADASFLTAFANDAGFEGVFERQVCALGRPGDALMGISTSGRSANVIRAVGAARAMDMRVVVLTGARGELAGMADVAIAVPTVNTQHIQEAHLAIGHAICDLVESWLFGRAPVRGDGQA